MTERYLVFIIVTLGLVILAAIAAGLGAYYSLVASPLSEATSVTDSLLSTSTTLASLNVLATARSSNLLMMENGSLQETSTGTSISLTVSVDLTTAATGLLTTDSLHTTSLLPPITFSSSGDNEQWVYADGVLIGHSDDWQVTLVSIIPAGTAVLAVKICDYHVVGGLLGSSSDGTILTDASWKCTRTPGAGNWTIADYNDSQWPAAATDYVNGQEPWGTRSGISARAKWIWNPPYVTNSNNVTVYCRKSLL